MKPLEKARDALGTARDGTVRTAAWVKDGIAGVPGRIRGSEASGEEAKDSPSGEGGLSSVLWKSGLTRLLHRAKDEPWLGAALVIGLLLFITWIAWTVYVWSENGANAGLGVLISWPAVLAVLGLVAAPFIGAAILIRRMAAGGGPSLAIAGGGTAEAPTGEGEDEDEDEDEDEGSESPAGEGKADSDDEGDADSEAGEE